jgi:hypothetical protein
MIVIAEFYARYRSTLPEGELDRVAENLLRFVETVAHDYYAERYNELGVTHSVRVEIGSTKSWVVIGSLVTVLTQYGSIREGIDYLIKDSHTLARLIVPGISRSLGLRAEAPEYHARRLGLPGKLHRLFLQVERREISPDEATNQALMLLQNQGGTDTPEELERLKQQFSVEFYSIAPGLSRRLDAQNSLRSGQETASRQPPKRMPARPSRSEPVLAPLPGLPFRRRQRRGVVATRDPQTGAIRISRY